MKILGINGIDGIFHDASASLLIDGRIIASVEEERFNKIKHSSGLPINAIKFCLVEANLTFDDLDMIGYYLSPDALLMNLFWEIISKYRIPKKNIQYYESVSLKIRSIYNRLKDIFNFKNDIPLYYLNHHLCHAASAYFLSKFREALILTIDGSGDTESAALFCGQNGKIFKVSSILKYPYSLGFIYAVIADLLGLGWIEGPGKLMALAAYGKPNPELFSDIIILKDDIDNPVEIDISFFDYHLGGKGLSKKGRERFGKARHPEEKFSSFHYEIAASVQKVMEDTILHIVRVIKKRYPDIDALCYAGGMALNILVNAKIKQSGLFSNIFIPPAAYDGGTSLGCALYLASIYEDNFSYPPNFSVYLGPSIKNDDIKNILSRYKNKLAWMKMSDIELVKTVAKDLAAKKIVGWIQGKMEWGPRALGNRSILSHPGSLVLKERLNTSIKKREFYRPFGVSILKECSSEWFDIDDSPYMLYECRVKQNLIQNIQAVIHINGTTRPQTITKEDNKLYYLLIRAFYEYTSLPLILNTSFNLAGETLVNTPEDALRIFMKTELDILVINNFYIQKLI